MITQSERVALVTGASSGIGRAIAVSLAAEGYAVCLVGRDQARLQAAAMDCGDQNIAVFSTDLAAPTAAVELKDFVLQTFKSVDVLVHCAGFYASSKTMNASLKDLDRMIASNIRAPYALTQLLLPYLVRSSGDIIFINSSITQHPRAETGQFGLTQHALKGLANSLRQEVNNDGVRVLSIYPGRVATPRQEQIYSNENRPYKPALILQAEDIATIVVKALALPRTAEITDIHVRPMHKT